MQLHEIVNIDPETMGGTPVFKNSRVPIEYLFEYLSDGECIAKFLDDFPGITSEQVLALIELKFKFPEIYETLIRPQHSYLIQKASV